MDIPTNPSYPQRISESHSSLSSSAHVPIFASRSTVSILPRMRRGRSPPRLSSFPPSSAPFVHLPGVFHRFGLDRSARPDPVLASDWSKWISKAMGVELGPSLHPPHVVFSSACPSPTAHARPPTSSIHPPNEDHGCHLLRTASCGQGPRRQPGRQGKPTRMHETTHRPTRTRDGRELEGWEPDQDKHTSTWPHVRFLLRKAWKPPRTDSRTSKNHVANFKSIRHVLPCHRAPGDLTRARD